MRSWTRAGRSTRSTVHHFHEAVAEAASLASHVVIDLADVTFVDSSGLGGLIVARTSARQNGGSLSLVSPPPMVRRLLGATRLHDVFAIYDSLPEAINAVHPALILVHQAWLGPVRGAPGIHCSRFVRCTEPPSLSTESKMARSLNAFIRANPRPSSAE